MMCEEKNKIRYVTLGINDLGRAAAFYDELLAEISAVRVSDQDRMCY